MTGDIPQDVPFTLSCYECDADLPDSHEEAIHEGWTEIQYFPEGLSENFLGLCPACREKEDEEASSASH